MTISNTLKSYLDNSGIAYETIEHPLSSFSQDTAQSAHVPGQRLAKGVLLSDAQGYLLAVLPAPMHVDLDLLNELLERDLLLVDEAEVAKLFPDCDVGAVPPIGKPFKLKVALDKSLCEEPDIYFEGGDHVELVRVGGTDFQTLQRGAKRLSFSY